MSKRLQVVLTQDVRKLGSNGDLVEVAPGYARNYLLPQGIATIATPGILRQVEQRRAKELERLAAERKEAEDRKVALKTVGKMTIRKQVGEDNLIFGTVTTQDIVDAIKERAGQDIDRRGVTIPEINKTGNYQAQVKLHPEVTAPVDFEVIPL